MTDIVLQTTRQKISYSGNITRAIVLFLGGEKKKKLRCFPQTNTWYKNQKSENLYLTILEL